jgi:excisionase family DNA binding protein
MTEPERMLTVAEVAERIGTTPRNVRHLIQIERLPAYRLAERTVRVSEHELETFLESTRTVA